VRKRLESQLADAAALAETRVETLERELRDAVKLAQAAKTDATSEVAALKERIATLESDETQKQAHARELADAEKRISNAELATADLRARLASAERDAKSVTKRAERDRAEATARTAELERAIEALRTTEVVERPVEGPGHSEEVESLESENAELRRRVTETFQALQGAHTVAEQTKRAAQETVKAAKRAQALAEADLTHVREELAAANAANALTSHAAGAQLDMDRSRLEEAEAALEAQQLALEAAQRNVAKESDRADAAAAAAARRASELNDAREEIDRLRGGGGGGRGARPYESSARTSPASTPRSSNGVGINPLTTHVSAVRTNRPPPAPTPAPSTAAKAAAAAMGRAPPSAYRRGSRSPSPRGNVDTGPGVKDAFRGHFADPGGAEGGADTAVQAGMDHMDGRRRASVRAGSQRARPHDWSNYPYEDNGNDSRGSGSVARAERRGARGGSGARDALDQELANARDVLDLIRGGAASSYAGSDDDSPR